MHGHHPAAGGGAGLRAPPHAVAARAQPRRLRSPRPGLDRARRAGPVVVPLVGDGGDRDPFVAGAVPASAGPDDDGADGAAGAERQMSQDQLDRMERTMSGPVGMAISIGPQAVFFPVLTLVMALLIWFGV